MFVVVAFLSVIWVNTLNASDVITCYAFRGNSGTQTFSMSPGMSEVTFTPNKTGSWYFKAWHTFLFQPKSYVAVFTFWKDYSNPNDTWHYWPGGGVACLYSFIPSKTLLKSGQPYIGYKFWFSNYNDFGLGIKINIEKQ